MLDNFLRLRKVQPIKIKPSGVCPSTEDLSLKLERKRKVRHNVWKHNVFAFLISIDLYSKRMFSSPMEEVIKPLRKNPNQFLRRRHKLNAKLAAM